MREAGHQVEVVTSFPNYPEGELYPGHELRGVARETISKIPVWRTYIIPDHGRGLLGRLLNYGSFMLSGILGGLLAFPFDVVYVWHPPLSVGVTAAVVGFLRGRPFVFDVQDVWPDSAIATGFLRPGRVVRWMSRLERIVYRWAGHILVVTDAAKENLMAKGVPEEKLSVLPHWYDDESIRTAPADARDTIRAKEGWGGRFVMMFAGNLGMMQGLDTIVRASRRLAQGTRILIVFVGDGSDRARLQELTKELGVEGDVRFVERVPSDEMGSYFRAADALLVHLRSTAVSEMVIPSKTMAYLAAAKPVIMANVGASATLVEKAGAGVAVPPDDPEALARAMESIAGRSDEERAELGRRGRRYFEEHFTQARVLPRYISMLEAVAAGRPVRTGGGEIP